MSKRKTNLCERKKIPLADQSASQFGKINANWILKYKLIRCFMIARFIAVRFVYTRHIISLIRFDTFQINFISFYFLCTLFITDFCHRFSHTNSHTVCHRDTNWLTCSNANIMWNVVTKQTFRLFSSSLALVVPICVLSSQLIYYFL